MYHRETSNKSDLTTTDNKPLTQVIQHSNPDTNNTEAQEPESPADIFLANQPIAIAEILKTEKLSPNRQEVRDDVEQELVHNLVLLKTSNGKDHDSVTTPSAQYTPSKFAQAASRMKSNKADSKNYTLTTPACQQCLTPGQGLDAIKQQLTKTEIMGIDSKTPKHQKAKAMTGKDFQNTILSSYYDSKAKLVSKPSVGSASQISIA